jgi:mRNA interferase MazF
MTRGSIVWVNLEGTTPPELGKTRPGLILSNTEANRNLATVVIIPISTRPGIIWPLRLGMPYLSGMKPGFLVVPGIRQVSKMRLHDEAGIVSDEFLHEVTEALAAYLGE